LITIAPNTERLHMNPNDMERLGLTDGTKVRVTTAQGKLDMGVQADLAMMPGSCFFPEHFNEPPVKDLMTVEIDRHTGVPYFKLTSATIEKI
jgi:formate dehydrogenase (NADP+) alpha subunit